MAKNYYQKLGVLDDAEDIVIKAAYKALAQRYHPDKWSGGRDEATRRMSDINEAYDVLSNPQKRKDYDATIDQYSFYTEPEGDELNSSINTDWEKATEFFPDLVDLAKCLRKTSKSLESSFKLTLLELKEFNRRRELAGIFEIHFLEKYFGKNPKIIDFVKKLIQSNERGALKAVNEAIRLLGSDVDPNIIVNKVTKDWNLNEHEAESEKFNLARRVLETNSIFSSIDFIQLLGGDVSGPKNNQYIVTTLNGSTNLLNKQKLLEHAKSLAHKIID